LAGALGRVTVFVALVLVAGLIAVPRLLRHVAKYKSDEMLLVTVLGLCFGVTLVAVKLGHSIALGAFIIGMIIGEAREIGKIKLLTEPVRDMFSAVFFVTIGLQINPSLLLQYAVPILVISAVVVAGKIAAFSTGTFLTGHDLRTSLRVGTCMVPIGELSFIIAALGVSLGVTSDFLYPVAVSVSAITMPLSPFLTRHAEGLAGWMERRLPPGLMKILAVYTRWVERLQLNRAATPARRLARRWLWQIALNVLLATGVFMLVATAADGLLANLPGLAATPGWLGGGKGLLWLVTVLVAMPALIAAVRKLEALALLLAETSAGLGQAGGRAAVAVQLVVSRVVFWGGIVGLGVWILVISAAVLPPWPGLLVLLAVIGVLGWLLWRYFIQIHAKAQWALLETLANNPATDGEPTGAGAPLSLLQAQMETVLIGPESPATGRLIRELALRSQTGASIVAIEREGRQTINPGPDEELHAGERVLLIGTVEQLNAARRLLLAPPRS
jgi:CPA2 family monovalent cation:H+ antiporter-2